MVVERLTLVFAFGDGRTGGRDDVDAPKSRTERDRPIETETPAALLNPGDGSGKRIEITGLGADKLLNTGLPKPGKLRLPTDHHLRCINRPGSAQTPIIVSLSACEGGSRIGVLPASAPSCDQIVPVIHMPFESDGPAPLIELGQETFRRRTR